MPRVSRSKARSHSSAVQLPSKRAFAVPEAQVHEVVHPGQTADEPTDSPRGEPSTARTRKGLQAALALHSATPAHPYSRSHHRREKRKAKQQLVGGELHSVAAALSESLGEAGAAQALASVRSKEEREAERAKRVEEGKIGKGRGRTMGEKARRKQIAVEARRIPAIMNHPAYKQNPWEAIRIHAGNTLATVDKGQGGPVRAGVDTVKSARHGREEDGMHGVK